MKEKECILKRAPVNYELVPLSIVLWLTGAFIFEGGVLWDKDFGRLKGWGTHQKLHDCIDISLTEVFRVGFECLPIFRVVISRCHSPSVDGRIMHAQGEVAIKLLSVSYRGRKGTLSVDSSRKFSFTYIWAYLIFVLFSCPQTAQ